MIICFKQENYNIGYKRRIGDMEEKIQLWETGRTPLYDESKNQPEPYITPFICKGAKTCMVICPGGGYGALAEHEGAPIGRWLNENGITAFVVNYRVKPYMYPCPQLDVQRAVRVVRSMCGKYGYRSDRIGIMGSSAGGHAACSEALLYGSFGFEEDELDKISARPDFMLLCYSVLDMGEYAHVGSRESLLGANPPEESVKRMSLFDKVTPDAPPAFLWHTANDAAVPVENSLLMAKALSKNKVPFALHCFENGPHGLGLSENNADVAQWKTLFISWLNALIH